MNVLEWFSVLRSKKRTARQAIEMALEAIEESAWLNAFCRVHRQEALDQATLADEETGAGQLAGPLHGIPIAIKDNMAERGQPNPAACRAYLHDPADGDATVVERLVQAGAIILGRTNMHELADGVTCEDSCYGPAHNPWRRGYHPGGSSGGSAAAVAAGLVPGALGTDTGGSVRIPASLCGVVGFKPSLDLVPTAGVRPLSTTLDHVGVIAATVRDAALLLEVVSDAPAGDFQAACEREAGGLRLGILGGFGLDPDPGLGRLLSDTLARLQRAGFVPTEVELAGLDQGIRLLAGIYPPEAARIHHTALTEQPNLITDLVRADLERGLAASPQRLERALQERANLSQKLDAAMDALDILITPTTPRPAQPIGSADAHTYLTYTCPFNLSGQPAISLPMGLVDGLPVGVQLIGRRGEDRTVLAMAARLERLIDFTSRPPLERPNSRLPEERT